MSPTEVKNLFEEFVSNSVEAFLFCDLEGKVLMWNKGCEYLFGYDREEIRKFTIFSLVSGGSFSNFTAMFEAAKKDRVICFETHCTTQSGDVFDAEVTCGLLNGREKPALYFVFKDTSRIGKYRKQLHSMAMFPDNTNDFIMEWERELGITYYNKSVKGYLEGGHNGKVRLENLLPRDFNNYMDRLAGTDRSLREVEAHFNGRTFSYTFVPYKLDENKVLVLGKDVTNHRRLEKEAGMAGNRTRSILNLIEGVLKEIHYVSYSSDYNFAPIIDRFMRDEKDTVSRKPSHVLIVRENEERLLEGFIYHKSHGIVHKLMKKVSFHPVELTNLISERDEIHMANWSDKCSSKEEFQELFPKPIVDNIEEIDNFVACRINGEPGGILVAFNYNCDVDMKVSDSIRGLAVAMGALVSVQSQLRQKEEAHYTFFTKIAQLVEERDRETGEHLKRVSSYSRLLAGELGKLKKFEGIIDNSFINTLYNSAPLHDIGKVGVPDAVLQKPGKLNDREYELMQKHTIVGGKVLEGPEFLETAREIAYYHHEKYDGSGYPYGLRGEEIPVAARIVALADVYDAMTSNRVYKDAFSHERTKKLIEICSGGHFDPDVVDAFLKREQDFIKIKEMYKS